MIWLSLGFLSFKVIINDNNYAKVILHHFFFYSTASKCPAGYHMTFVLYGLL